MEQPNSKTQEIVIDEATKAMLKAGVNQLQENGIGKPVMAGAKRIAYVVSFPDDGIPRKEHAFGISESDGVMFILNKPEGGFSDKYNNRVQGNEPWMVAENMTPEQFRSSLTNLSANEVCIGDSTDSKSPQSAERVNAVWNTVIKPDIAKAKERRGVEAVKKRIVDGAKAVAQDLKEMFNLPDTSIAPNGASQGAQLTPSA